jgi:hypothetical protein
MHPVIHFKSRRFDLSSEPGNPINPIRGASLLDWFRAKLPAELGIAAAEPEDWGWYTHVTWRGRQYLIGTCAHEADDGDHEWVVQIDKSRTFMERILGRERMTEDDPVFTLVRSLIENEPGFTEFSVERGP